MRPTLLKMLGIAALAGYFLGGTIGCVTEPADQFEEIVATPPDPAAVSVDPGITEEVQRVLEAPEVKNAFSIIEKLEPRTYSDHITLTQIPAPPFKEARRAAAFAEMLADAGADSVWIDAEGNALALKKGTVRSRVVAVGAHLDTVFPEGTDVTVKHRNDTLFAPGIGDDTRGLVEVLTLLRAMHGAGIQVRGDILFIGTVGEEGLGDLRGVKYLFSDEGPGIDSWIAIDGGKIGNIVHRGLGSHRYRITYQGPGGHSWGAFGLANPHHALGEAIHRFVEKADGFTRSGPKTSYSVGRIYGGTSVNAIPFESWMEIDMRSEDPERLSQIDALLQEAVREALDAQNALRRMGPALTMDVEKIGDRPSGTMPIDTPIIQRAIAAAKMMGATPSFSMSSTDSNIPIAMGIPAITVGRGGKGGNAHSLDEWWINEDGHVSIQWTLLTLVAEAGLSE